MEYPSRAERDEIVFRASSCKCTRASARHKGRRFPSELAASPPLSLSLSLSLQVARSNPAVICSSDSFPMSTQFPRHIGPAPGCCCIAQPAGEEQAKPGKREGKWRWPALFARVKGELEITKSKGRKRRPRGLTGGGRGTSRWW